MNWIPVIGLEVHAELQTRSKMFCGCPAVDSTQAPPNTAVCPVCAGMPGVLPVVNRKAVEYAIKVGLALECRINPTSLFARKNYFYPDLPKGYQISQYEYPLAEGGVLAIPTPQGDKLIRIRRAHLEEDTGKLTHTQEDGQSFTLVDLNRAGIPLLEIVTEPDMNSIEEVGQYARILHGLLVCLGVNSGDMSKGVMRFEANVSLRPETSLELGTRVEIKNLNSFRAMERAIAYELERQAALLESGQPVVQQTLGWDDAAGATYAQRGKEEAHDYRYFPEPDLPPLVVEDAWIEEIRRDLPELPQQRIRRYERQYSLTGVLAAILVEDTPTAEYFEATADALSALGIPAMEAANWITGPLFSWMNENSRRIEQVPLKPAHLAGLIAQVKNQVINVNTARTVLLDMLESGQSAEQIIAGKNLGVVNQFEPIRQAVQQVLEENPVELANYLGGKTTLENWFFGQAMRLLGGKANPAVLRNALQQALEERHSRKHAGM
jgi:aspartyl-tRNA(Asn)/glutamyl-tRNA(Gln) amidotransferase subunit B